MKPNSAVCSDVLTIPCPPVQPSRPTLRYVIGRRHACAVLPPIHQATAVARKIDTPINARIGKIEVSGGGITTLGALHASPRSEMVTETTSSGSTPVIVSHAPGVVKEGMTWTFSEPTRTETTATLVGHPIVEHHDQMGDDRRADIRVDLPQRHGVGTDFGSSQQGTGIVVAMRHRRQGNRHRRQ